MRKSDYRERVEIAVAEGKLWRAKEILQGNISIKDYDCDLYESYGRLLLLLNDLPQAGKYLFLSGRDKPEYKEAVDLYVSRYTKNGWQNLYATFPTQAKLLDLNDYPEAVSSKLRKLGYPEEEKRKLKDSFVHNRPTSWRERIEEILAVTVVLFLLLSMIIGIIVIIKTVIKWIFV